MAAVETIQANNPKAYSLSRSLVSGKTFARAVLKLTGQKTPESVVRMKKLLTLVGEEMRRSYVIYGLPLRRR
ncbi:hypothetical protein [Spirosoma flavum]|uniref:Transposase n=1 Tax=Spirosoma flavum TaxID=2048557 RepID=A0ABW6ALV4_9BACT